MKRTLLALLKAKQFLSDFYLKKIGNQYPLIEHDMIKVVILTSRWQATTNSILFIP